MSRGVCSHLLCAVEASRVCQGVVSCVQSWRCCEGTTLERKRSFHLCTQQIMNHWIRSSGWKRNVVLLGGKYCLFVKKKKTACGDEQREACGNALKSGLIFPLFLPYHWLDQAWWMMEGVRGGWGADRTCSQSCPSLQNVRKTRDCCVWATEERHAAEEEGKVDALGERRLGVMLGEVGGGPESRTAQEVYRSFYWWHLMNMYIPL